MPYVCRHCASDEPPSVGGADNRVRYMACTDLSHAPWAYNGIISRWRLAR